MPLQSIIKLFKDNPFLLMHPNIILDFVPAGCTGVWQACYIGIQRIFNTH
jgi:hypothetical protein